MHTTQTAGLALATDLTPPESHAKVVGLMYVMLLAGMIVSALAFGAALANFSPGRLIQVVQGAAVVCVVLNGIAMWKQETRRPLRGAAPRAPDPTFRESWAASARAMAPGGGSSCVGIGTMAFAMADILLEPFGGQILLLSVATTTKLTALLALGGLLGFGFASRALSRGADPYRMAQNGALIGLPAFALVIIAAPTGMPGLYLLGQLPDRLRRRPVRPRHPDRHHEPRPASIRPAWRSAPGARCRPRPRAWPWRSAARCATSSTPWALPTRPGVCPWPPTATSPCTGSRSCCCW